MRVHTAGRMMLRDAARELDGTYLSGSHVIAAVHAVDAMDAARAHMHTRVGRCGSVPIRAVARKTRSFGFTPAWWLTRWLCNQPVTSLNTTRYQIGAIIMIATTTAMMPVRAAQGPGSADDAAGRWSSRRARLRTSQARGCRVSLRHLTSFARPAGSLLATVTEAWPAPGRRQRPPGCARAAQAETRERARRRRRPVSSA